MLKRVGVQTFSPGVALLEKYLILEIKIKRKNLYLKMDIKICNLETKNKKN